MTPPAPATAAVNADQTANLDLPQSRFATLDLLCLACLYAIFAALVLPYDRLPMLMVDESRNALNAQSIALHGHWLVPYYDGQPEHWNTKPPLLIWMIAGWMRLGLPPLLALRLTSLVAAAATLGVLWFCRHVLHDRLAAFLSGLLLLTCSLYMGPHVARSGDYDALLCAFTLGQAVAMWLAIEPGGTVRLPAYAVWAACLVGAVMTKSIAGALILPGLLAFAIVRGRLPMLLRDWRVWALTAAALGVCVAYYATRPLYDPGYWQAAWQNDLGGRFTQVHDKNTGGPLYYLMDLARRYEPGLLLLPLAGFALRSVNPLRRSAALLCLLTSGALVLVISAAKTKLYWYTAPAIPLLSIATGLGIVDALAWLSRQQWLGWLRQRRLAHVGLALLFTAAVLVGVVRNQFWSFSGLRAPTNDQFWYADFLDTLRTQHGVAHLIVVDGGMPNHDDFPNYTPMLDFYARFESQHGMPVTVQPPGTLLPVDAEVATCDRHARDWLQAHETLAIRQQDSMCVFGRIVSPHPAERRS